MELLDIVDENGIPTGEVIDREIAHEKGIRHRTAHVWVARKKEYNIQVLLQRRSMDKDAYPGCFDASSAGHIPAGCGYVESAMRELKEELGFDSNESEYIFCGVKKHTPIQKNIFHGKEFLDYEVSAVYVIYRDVEAEDICFQREEIDSVQWMDFDACMEMVRLSTRANCIDLRELKMIEKIFEDGFRRLAAE